MRRRAWTALVSYAAAVLAAAPVAIAQGDQAPVARVAPVTDDYFGTRITDPYRWMESEPQPEFNHYLHAENDHARAVLARIPGRDALARDIDSVTGLIPSVNNVIPAGGRVFFLKRDVGGQIARLTVRDAQGHDRVLVDPARFNAGGAHAEIDQFAPSDDGSLVTYGISIGGSENSTLHVIETATGAARPDVIDRAKFASVSWAPRREIVLLQPAPRRRRDRRRGRAIRPPEDLPSPSRRRSRAGQRRARRRSSPVRLPRAGGVPGRGLDAAVRCRARPDRRRRLAGIRVLRRPSLGPCWRSTRTGSSSPPRTTTSSAWRCVAIASTC